MEYKLQFNFLFEINTGIMEERMPNYDELQNYVSDDGGARTSPFIVFISPKQFFSFFTADTNTPILSHVRTTFPFRRGNIGMGSQ